MHQGFLNFFRSNSGDLLRYLDGTRGVVFDPVNLQIGGAEEPNSIATPKNPPTISLADFAKDKDAALIAMQGTQQAKSNDTTSVATTANGAITTPETGANAATATAAAATVAPATVDPVAVDSVAETAEATEKEGDTDTELVAPTNAPGSAGTVTPIVPKKTPDYSYPNYQQPSKGYTSNYGYGGIDTMTMIGVGAVVVLLIIMIIALMTR
tara:strand:+ start:6564 stop:7196 length:633 start_codon:yes stop_codon:yes gene_type:complete